MLRVEHGGEDAIMVTTCVRGGVAAGAQGGDADLGCVVAKLELDLAAAGGGQRQPDDAGEAVHEQRQRLLDNF